MALLTTVAKGYCRLCEHFQLCHDIKGAADAEFKMASLIKDGEHHPKYRVIWLASNTYPPRMRRCKFATAHYRHLLQRKIVQSAENNLKLASLILRIGINPTRRTRWDTSPTFRTHGRWLNLMWQQ